MHIQNIKRIISKPNVVQRQIQFAPQTVLQLTWFRKTFLLTNKFGTAWAIEMTTDRKEWS